MTYMGLCPLDSYNVLPDKGIYLSQMVGEDQTEPFRLHILYLHVLLKPLLTIASYNYLKTFTTWFKMALSSISSSSISEQLKIHVVFLYLVN